MFKCLSMIPSSTLDAHVSIIQFTVPVFNFDSATCTQSLTHTNIPNLPRVRIHNSNREFEIRSRSAWIVREFSLPSFLHHLFPLLLSSWPFNWPLSSFDSVTTLVSIETVVFRGIKLARDDCRKRGIETMIVRAPLVKWLNLIPALVSKQMKKSYCNRSLCVCVCVSILLYYFVSVPFNCVIRLLLEQHDRELRERELDSRMFLLFRAYELCFSLLVSFPSSHPSIHPSINFVSLPSLNWTLSTNFILDYLSRKITANITSS